MKSFITTTLVVSFLFPILASAAWWNPFSWGKEPVPVVQDSPTRDMSQIEKPVDKQQLILKEKPEKIEVIKTITVTDPALQKQINDLIAQNTKLVSQVTALQEYVEELEDDKKDAEDDLDELLDEKREMEDCEASLQISDLEGSMKLGSGSLVKVPITITTESCDSMNGQSLIINYLARKKPYYTESNGSIDYVPYTVRPRSVVIGFAGAQPVYSSQRGNSSATISIVNSSKKNTSTWQAKTSHIIEVSEPGQYKAVIQFDGLEKEIKFKVE